MALLEIRDLCVNYGPIQAVRNINMDVDEGSIVALLGANGAGKTTTLRTISGVIKPASGSVKFDGNEIGGRRASRVARLGVNMSPEGRLIFNELSVEENLRAGAYCIRSRAETERNMKRVLTLFPRLEERLKQHAGTLSGGEQQMLAIARALMADPKVLLLDEPSLGLAPLLVRSIFDSVRKINRQGVTVILVEQNARAALKLASRGYVIEVGRVVMEDASEALLANPDVQAAYLGGGQENGQEN